MLKTVAAPIFVPSIFSICSEGAKESRETPRALLTSDGLSLLPFVKSVCSEYQQLQMQVDGLNGLQTGLIRIGTFSRVAAHWLPGIIREFQKNYPNIDYELLLGDYEEIEAGYWKAGSIAVFCGCLYIRTETPFF